jgi:hypothetical protein
MNLKVLVIILIYFSSMVLLFNSDLESSLTTAGYTDLSSVALNDSALQPEETGTGGIFSIGISVSRFFGFVTVGIGLGDVPTWFQILFSTWSIAWSMFIVAFIIDSVWSG